MRLDAQKVEHKTCVELRSIRTNGEPDGEFTTNPCFAGWATKTTHRPGFQWKISVGDYLRPHALTFIKPLLKYDWDITDFDEKKLIVTWKFKDDHNAQSFYVKLMAFGSLVRMLGEFPHYVVKWFEYIDFMPPDEAYITCMHSKAEDPMWYGHLFSPGLQHLTSLQGFTFQHYIDNIKEHRTAFYTLITLPFFGLPDDPLEPWYGKDVPDAFNPQHYIPFTPAIYQKLCEMQPLDTIEKRKEFFQFVNQKGQPKYVAIDLSAV